MTPERLAEIRERAKGGSKIPAAIDRADLLAHVDHLTAEVERMRVGIEALVDDPRPHESDRDGDGACVDAEALVLLLSPPTEGETDE